MRNTISFKLGIAFILLFLSIHLSAQREGGANLDPSVNGYLVGSVIEQSAQSVFNWVQLDFGWKCTNTTTGKDQGTFIESARDEWSVYITNVNTSRKFKIDLWEKKVYDLSTGLETYGDIIQVGLAPENNTPANPTSQWTAFTPSSEYYFITNVGNQKIFDVTASKTNVGTNVGISASTTGKNQKFRFISKGSGYYAIETALKANTFLSIHNSGKTDNTNIKLNAPVGNQQHFKLEKNATGQIRFVSKLGNDLYLGTDDNGQNLVLRKGEKGNKILFTLTLIADERENTNPPIPSATHWESYMPSSDYFFITNVESQKIFHVTDSKTSVGTNVALSNNLATKSQKFRFISKGGGYYTIETALKSNTFLSIHNSGKSDNTNIKLNNPVGNQQHFRMEENALGEVRFISKLGTDLYLGMDDNGKNLVLRKGDKGNKTRFLLKKTTITSGNNNSGGNSTAGKITFKNTANTFVVTITKVGDNDFEKVVGPLKSTSVNANSGDVFMFSTNSDGFEALPYTVSKLGLTHKIVVGERYTSGKGNKLPNVKANRHSFDIKKVDPIFIDYSKTQAIKDVKGKTIGYGGMRMEIFEPLKNQDIDWNNQDGDYATKNHFTYDLLMETSASTETKMFYSSSSYEESFSANVGADTPKGGGSASFSHTSGNSNSETNIYSYSRTKVRAYSVKLKKENIAMTAQFKNAVKALPKTYNATTYRNFINKWGTHYPVSTTYGGVQVAAYKFKATDMMQSESMALGIKGNVKKASAGGGYSSSEEHRQKQENSKGIHRAKGGSGTGENFAVDMSNSVPVEIDLKRLHELISAQYFNDGTSDSELSARKTNLKRALTEYIGSATDNGRSLKPRMYKIHKPKWTATKGESDFQVYGTMWISMWKGDKEIAGMGQNAWSRSDEGGARVVAKTNTTIKGSGELIYTVYPVNGRMNLDDYYIKLSSSLNDWNAGSSNEHGGYKKETIKFSNVPILPKEIDHNVYFPREETRIRVSATVQEINLGFDE